MQQLLTVAQELRANIDLRDRFHNGFTVYQNSFVGSSAVSWLAASRHCPTHTRAQAVSLGLRLQKAGFFHAATPAAAEGAPRQGAHASAATPALFCDSTTALFRFFVDEDRLFRRFWSSSSGSSSGGGVPVALPGGAGAPPSLALSSITNSAVGVDGGTLSRGFLTPTATIASPAAATTTTTTTGPRVLLTVATTKLSGAKQISLSPSASSTDINGKSAAPSATELSQFDSAVGAAVSPAAADGSNNAFNARSGMISGTSPMGLHSPLAPAPAAGISIAETSAALSYPFDNNNTAPTLNNSISTTSIASTAAAAAAAAAPQSSPALMLVNEFLSDGGYDPAAWRVQPHITCNSSALSIRLAEAMHGSAHAQSMCIAAMELLAHRIRKAVAEEQQQAAAVAAAAMMMSPSTASGDAAAASAALLHPHHLPLLTSAPHSSILSSNAPSGDQLQLQYEEGGHSHHQLQFPSVADGPAATAWGQPSSSSNSGILIPPNFSLQSSSSTALPPNFNFTPSPSTIAATVHFTRIRAQQRRLQRQQLRSLRTLRARIRRLATDGVVAPFSLTPQHQQSAAAAASSATAAAQNGAAGAAAAGASFAPAYTGGGLPASPATAASTGAAASATSTSTASATTHAAAAAAAALVHTAGILPPAGRWTPVSNRRSSGRIAVFRLDLFSVTPSTSTLFSATPTSVAADSSASGGTNFNLGAPLSNFNLGSGQLNLAPGAVVAIPPVHPTFKAVTVLLFSPDDVLQHLLDNGLRQCWDTGFETGHVVTVVKTGSASVFDTLSAVPTLGFRGGDAVTSPASPTSSSIGVQGASSIDIGKGDSVEFPSTGAGGGGGGADSVSISAAAAAAVGTSALRPDAPSIRDSRNSGAFGGGGRNSSGSSVAVSLRSRSSGTTSATSVDAPAASALAASAGVLAGATTGAAPAAVKPQGKSRLQAHRAGSSAHSSVSSRVDQLQLGKTGGDPPPVIAVDELQLASSPQLQLASSPRTAGRPGLSSFFDNYFNFKKQQQQRQAPLSPTPSPPSASNAGALSSTSALSSPSAPSTPAPSSSSTLRSAAAAVTTISFNTTSDVTTSVAKSNSTAISDKSDISCVSPVAVSSARRAAWGHSSDSQADSVASSPSAPSLTSSAAYAISPHVGSNSAGKTIVTHGAATTSSTSLTSADTSGVTHATAASGASITNEVPYPTSTSIVRFSTSSDGGGGSSRHSSTATAPSTGSNFQLQLASTVKPSAKQQQQQQQQRQAIISSGSSNSSSSAVSSSRSSTQLQLGSPATASPKLVAVAAKTRYGAGTAALALSSTSVNSRARSESTLSQQQQQQQCGPTSTSVKGPPMRSDTPGSPSTTSMSIRGSPKTPSKHSEMPAQQRLQHDQRAGAAHQTSDFHIAQSPSSPSASSSNVNRWSNFNLGSGKPPSSPSLLSVMRRTVFGGDDSISSNNISRSNSSSSSSSNSNRSSGGKGSRSGSTVKSTAAARRTSDYNRAAPASTHLPAPASATAAAQSPSSSNVGPNFNLDAVGTPSSRTGAAATAGAPPAIRLLPGIISADSTPVVEASASSAAANAFEVGAVEVENNTRELFSTHDSGEADAASVSPPVGPSQGSYFRNSGERLHHEHSTGSGASGTQVEAVPPPAISSAYSSSAPSASSEYAATSVYSTTGSSIASSTAADGTVHYHDEQLQQERRRAFINSTDSAASATSMSQSAAAVTELPTSTSTQSRAAPPPPTSTFNLNVSAALAPSTSTFDDVSAALADSLLPPGCVLPRILYRRGRQAPQLQLPPRDAVVLQVSARVV